MTTTDVRQTPFVKQLVANDRPTREAGLSSLRTYLSANRNLTPSDLLKLWKGLFYCLWMTDRPRPQAQLCDSLSSLLSILPPSTTLPFLRAFWITIAREWTGIDVLRMEKFLLLVRRFLGASFEVLKEGRWKEDEVEGMIAVLGEGPLVVGDLRAPMGLRYHVVDIYVDELERVGALEKGEDGEEVPLEKLLEPLRNLAKDSPTKMVRIKSKEALENERLPGNEKKLEEDVQEDPASEDGEDDGWEGFD